MITDTYNLAGYAIIGGTLLIMLAAWLLDVRRYNRDRAREFGKHLAYRAERREHEHAVELSKATTGATTNHAADFRQDDRQAAIVRRIDRL